MKKLLSLFLFTCVPLMTMDNTPHTQPERQQTRLSLSAPWQRYVSALLLSASAYVLGYKHGPARLLGVGGAVLGGVITSKFQVVNSKKCALAATLCAGFGIITHFLLRRTSMKYAAPFLCLLPCAFALLPTSLNGMRSLAQLDHGLFQIARAQEAKQIFDLLDKNQSQQALDLLKKILN